MFLSLSGGFLVLSHNFVFSVFLNIFSESINVNVNNIDNNTVGVYMDRIKDLRIHWCLECCFSLCFFSTYPD